MRRLVCVLLLLTAALPASARAAADPLAVKDGRFVDGHGRAVVLHGVNVVYKLAPYTPDFTHADARRLRGWGMNAIRLGVSWWALELVRGAIDAAYVRRVVDGADAAGVGWLYWQYKTYGDPTTSAAAEGPDAESIVTPAGAVKAAKVRELARAYPMRVAGRGARWSYRVSDGRFTLRWTSARGADTVVAVPRVAYPRGFSVRAHGVRVIRRAPLTLRGAGRASITITRR